MAPSPISKSSRSSKSGEAIFFGPHPPFGFRFEVVDGERSLVEVPAQREAWRLGFDALMEGGSLRSVARLFNAEGVPTARGARSWSAQVVRGVYRNPVYAGRFVSAAEWRALQARLDRGRVVERRRHEYLLRGRLWCAGCGARMIGSAHSRRGRLYLYYECPTRDVRAVPAGALDGAVWAELERLGLGGGAGGSFMERRSIVERFDLRAEWHADTKDVSLFGADAR